MVEIILNFLKGYNIDLNSNLELLQFINLNCKKIDDVQVIFLEEIPCGLASDLTNDGVLFPNVDVNESSNFKFEKLKQLLKMDEIDNYVNEKKETERRVDLSAISNHKKWDFVKLYKAIEKSLNSNDFEMYPLPNTDKNVRKFEVICTVLNQKVRLEIEIDSNYNIV